MELLHYFYILHGAHFKKPYLIEITVRFSERNNLTKKIRSAHYLLPIRILINSIITKIKAPINIYKEFLHAASGTT